jgi:hypothetical protein
MSQFSRHAKFGRRATVTLGTGHEASADWVEPLLGEGSDCAGDGRFGGSG